MNKDVLDTLITARDLITDPAKWNREYFGMTADGAMNTLRQVVSDIPSFNDWSPHEDVIAAFDIAICLAS